MQRIVTAIIVVVIATMASAQTARDHAVECHAVAGDDASAWHIVLDKSTASDATLSIAVKGPGDTDWQSFDLQRHTMSDSTIVARMPYPVTDVRVRVRRGDTLQADGYLRIVRDAEMIGVSPQRVGIVVDADAATALAPELARWRDDLRREGWCTDVVVVPPSARPRDAAAVRRAIRASYLRTDLAPLTHLLLVGAVPTPYAGGFRVGTVAEPPDGHPEHGGAWASDAYYADMDIAPGIDADEAWTDAVVNISDTATAYWERNRNVPGDGKFDQTTLPSDAELAVGRVDMRDLAAFGTGVDDRSTEFALLRRYFDKVHRYRTTGGAIPRRALIDDNFGAFTYDEQGLRIREAFAASGWRSFAPLVDSVVVGDWVPSSTSVPSLDTLPCLFTYACGGGGFEHCSFVATTQELASSPLRAPFTMLFGSYFGDVAAPNNIMRATIAAEGDAVVCGWSGRPHWFLHPMAAGTTIGECLLLTQNNDGTYVGATQRPLDGSTIAPFRLGQRGVHIQLVGDPTLRLPGPSLTECRFTAAPMIGSTNVDIVLTADDDAQVMFEAGPTPDGPWSPIGISTDVRRDLPSTVTIPGPLRERYLRAIILRRQTVVGARSRSMNIGRGAILDVPPATSVATDVTDTEDRTYYDLLGRPVRIGTVPTSAGCYLWRAGTRAGTVMVP